MIANLSKPCTDGRFQLLKTKGKFVYEHLATCVLLMICCLHWQKLRIFVIFNYRNSFLPWIYYTENGLKFQEGDRILDDDKLTTEYTFSPVSSLEYRVARYTLNGTYLGISNVTDGRLQLCSDTTSRLNAAYTFGTYYEQSVSLTDIIFVFHFWHSCDEQVINKFYTHFVFTFYAQ